jgi:hypothetical protein
MATCTECGVTSSSSSSSSSSSQFSHFLKFSSNYRHFPYVAGVSPAIWCTQSLVPKDTCYYRLCIHLMHCHSHCSQSIPLDSACPQFPAQYIRCHCATGCCVDTAEGCGAADMSVSTYCVTLCLQAAALSIVWTVRALPKLPNIQLHKTLPKL